MDSIIRSVALLFGFLSFSQSPWPAENWSQATPLTAVMDAAGVQDLSGLHWNPQTNRLYLVQGSGFLRVLQLNTATNTFSQLAYKALTGGPEGITQADYNATEFYVIAENEYEIRKYTTNAGITTISESRHWDLLNAPSPMNDTGNSGPEGIAFVPDSALSAIGFVSEQTGNPYTSVKGMGGLMFIAHQDGGYIWVFDINPNTSNDFAYVGKYKSAQQESCDLAFDRTTGLLYILHNVSGNNRLEVSDLSSAIVNGERKLNDVDEILIPNAPGSNDNIEGFALSPKCPDSGTVSAWLCRDTEDSDSNAIQQDALRWFNPFAAAGNCTPLGTDLVDTATFEMILDPADDLLSVAFADNGPHRLTIINAQGRSVLTLEGSGNSLQTSVATLADGFYIAEINTNGRILRRKFLKN